MTELPNLLFRTMNKDEKGNSVSLLPVLSVLTQLRLSELQFNCHCENSKPDSTNNFCCSRCGLYYHGACYNIEQECVIGSTVADDPFVCGPCSVEKNIPCSSNSVKCFYEKKNIFASDEDCASFKLQALIARVIRSLRKNEFLNLQMLKSSD
ncbi:uncharacterized protein LOC111713780, partial [Eurytemora carolleeae]|uniref:uncharacterized protein LOC111713780 n=1 Tax=Eurytemora carolleeae TaxID=1294199 RepID=UPI000C78AEB9